MSEELSTSMFSLTGRMGRLAYFIQNSILMTFAFEYLYASHLMDAMRSMQHMEAFRNVFSILKSTPGASDFFEELNHPKPAATSYLLIKLAFIVALRIVDLKRVRDIAGRQLTAIETSLVAVIFSLPFVDLISTIFLMTMPSKKKGEPGKLLKEAHATNVQEAQRERLIRRNQELFETGKISKAEYMMMLEKYNASPKKK